MYPKYYVIVRKCEDENLVILEFDDFEDARNSYEEYISDGCFDCAIYRRFHHSYTSI